MNTIPDILLARLITWEHLAKRPLDYIMTNENMSSSDQSELIQSQFFKICQEVQAKGFEIDSDDFKSAKATFEEKEGLENILFFILSDFEKDNPKLPDFGKV